MLKEKWTKQYSFGEQRSNDICNLSAVQIGARDTPCEMTVSD